MSYWTPAAQTTRSTSPANTARKFIKPLTGLDLGPQKNRCLNLLDTDWILALDTDEILTPELAEEIRVAIASSQANVYALPRLSNYCGRWMRHSGWYPDFVPRLFSAARPARMISCTSD